MVLRIFKMIATSGFMTALKCTKFVFRLHHFLRPPSLRGLLLKEEGERKKGKGLGEGKSKGPVGIGPLTHIPGSALTLLSKPSYRRQLV